MLKYDTDLDRAFHALSDATRRAMIDQLADGPLSVSDLAKPFDATLAAIVQHVQVLESSGLIETEKVGRVRTCRLSAESIERVERWLTERRQLWQARFDRLGALLEGPDSPETDKRTPKP